MYLAIYVYEQDVQTFKAEWRNLRTRLRHESIDFWDGKKSVKKRLSVDHVSTSSRIFVFKTASQLVLLYTNIVSVQDLKRAGED